jgi:hypothetical protein
MPEIKEVNGVKYNVFKAEKYASCKGCIAKIGTPLCVCLSPCLFNDYSLIFTYHAES